jgi:hypothetical protein
MVADMAADMAADHQVAGCCTEIGVRQEPKPGAAMHTGQPALVPHPGDSALTTCNRATVTA